MSDICLMSECEEGFSLLVTSGVFGSPMEKTSNVLSQMIHDDVIHSLPKALQHEAASNPQTEVFG